MAIDWVCEVSSNHNGNLTRALRFIEAAHQIGATTVKFQLFKITQLFAAEALAARPELLARQAWELPVAWLPTLAARAHELHLRFSCTPFYMAAVEELAPYVDSYKVASYQVLWLDLLRKIAAQGKPVALALGMATVAETDAAVDALRACPQLTLLHCVSRYPTPLAECRLSQLAWLRARYPGCIIGWSDHSTRPEALLSATLRYGALAIEFHLDLDGSGVEYAGGHCWRPAAIQAVIQTVQQALTADGGGTEAEAEERLWRSDPHDGLRPRLSVRAGLHG